MYHWCPQGSQHGVSLLEPPVDTRSAAETTLTGPGARAPEVSGFYPVEAFDDHGEVQRGHVRKANIANPGPSRLDDMRNHAVDGLPQVRRRQFVEIDEFLSRVTLSIRVSFIVERCMRLSRRARYQPYASCNLMECYRFTTSC